MNIMPWYTTITARKPIPVHACCGLYTWRLGKRDNAGAWHQVNYIHFK